MNTETNPDMTRDTTLTEPAECPSDEPGPKRKRTVRRKNARAPRSAANTKRTDSQTGFKVPVGDSGEIVQSAWHFGG
jgi:hypothetical protein